MKREKGELHQTYDLIGNTELVKGEVISEVAIIQVVDLSSKG